MARFTPPWRRSAPWSRAAPATATPSSWPCRRPATACARVRLPTSPSRRERSPTWSPFRPRPCRRSAHARTVLVLSKGELTRKVVTVGMVGDDYTQVLSGLTPGESVVLADYAESVPSSSTNTLGGVGGLLGGAEAASSGWRWIPGGRSFFQRTVVGGGSPPAAVEAQAGTDRLSRAYAVGRAAVRPACRGAPGRPEPPQARVRPTGPGTVPSGRDRPGAGPLISGPATCRGKRRCARHP